MAALSDLPRTLARHSAFRFLVIGGLSLVVDAGCLFLLHGVVHVWLWLATVLAYGVAFVVNFGLNRLWVFEAGGAVGGQLARYIAMVGVNLALTVLFVEGLVTVGMPYMPAKLGTAAVLAVMNYAVSRRWVFAAPA